MEDVRKLLIDSKNINSILIIDNLIINIVGRAEDSNNVDHEECTLSYDLFSIEEPA